MTKGSTNKCWRGSANQLGPVSQHLFSKSLVFPVIKERKRVWDTLTTNCLLCPTPPQRQVFTLWRKNTRHLKPNKSLT